MSWTHRARRRILDLHGSLGHRSAWHRRSLRRARLRRHVPGRRARAPALPGRPARLFLRRRLGARARRDRRLVHRAAALRPGLRPPLDALADAGRAAAGRRRPGRRGPRASLRPHVRGDHPVGPRRRRLPPRGLALCQLRVGSPPGHRHEPVLGRGQRGLRARAAPGHASAAAPGPARHGRPAPPARRRRLRLHPRARPAARLPTDRSARLPPATTGGRSRGSASPSRCVPSCTSAC